MYHIALPAPLEGFDHFINVWLCRREGAFLVDVGPSSAATSLIEALERLDVDSLDWLLLTHIHLDHAGGIGRVVRRFPESRVVCHASAIPHLVAPSRLWEGTLKTLGALAKAYGPIEGVPEERLVDVNRFVHPFVNAVPTPGHAAHHVSYLMGKTLFIGEAGGVILPVGLDPPYMRPATPPKLFLATFIESLDRLIALKPERLCCGHFGAYSDAVRLMNAHKRQLLLWARCVRETLDQDALEDPVENCLDLLLQTDPWIRGLSQMGIAAQDRERFFMKNSIRGFIGDLERQKAL